MPQSPSAKKALRQSHKRRLLNRGQRSEIRTVIKKVRTSIAAGDVAAAKEAYKAAQKKLDQAGDKHLFHANKVSRLKSRLVAAIKKIELEAKAKTAG
jgi:small subunit ribosomal protein S20